MTRSLFPSPLAPSPLPAAEPGQGARTAWLLFLAVLAGYALLFAVTEKIGYGNGFGMDGKRYAHWAMTYKGIFDIAAYETWLARFLPSAVVHYALTALRLPLDRDHVIAAFGGLNAFCIALSASLCHLTLLRLRVGATARWLGLLSLLFSYGAGKWLLYYPVLTDGVALLLGAALLYGYVARRLWVMLPATLAACFTWPSAFYVGLLLMVFPAHRRVLPDPPRQPARWQTPAAWILAAGIAGLSLWVFRGEHFQMPFSYITKTHRGLLPLSYLLLLAYAALAIRGLLRSDPALDARRLLGAASPAGIALTVLILAGLSWLKHAVFHSNPSDGEYERGMVLGIMEFGVAAPGKFFIPHVVFCGPILLLTAGLWGAVCREASRLGYGLTALLGIAVLHGFDSETRHLMPWFPTVMVLTVTALDRLAQGRPFPVRFLAAYAGAVALMSQLWLRLGGAPVPADIHVLGDQWFYMSHGPFSTWLFYAVQVTVILLVAALLYAVRPFRGQG